MSLDAPTTSQTEEKPLSHVERIKAYNLTKPAENVLLSEQVESTQDDTEQDDETTQTTTGETSLTGEGEEDTEEDSTSLPDTSRMSAKGKNRVQALANRAKQAADRADAAEAKLKEHEAFSPLVAEWRAMGFNSAEELKTAIAKQQEEANYADYLNKQSASIQKRFNDGEIDERTMGVEWQLEQIRVERAREQAQATRDRERLATVEREASEIKVLSLDENKVVKEKGMAVYNRLVKAGATPAEAAKETRDTLKALGIVSAQNTAVEKAKNGNRQNGAPSTGGRDRTGANITQNTSRPKPGDLNALRKMNLTEAMEKEFHSKRNTV